MSTPITSDIDFEKDGKQVTYLHVPYSRNDSAWGALLIPIVVIKNGIGPTIYFNGGSHGGEYEGPVCLLKLIRELEPKHIQGRVIIIPALNLPAVKTGERLSPIDNKDMNRVFPGKSNGTISEVVAHYVHDFILPLCDVVIDLHSGGYSLELMPFISMHYLENEIQRKDTLAALTAFQAPLSLISREFTGEGLLDYAVEGMGKIFLWTELGGGGRVTASSVKIAETGVRNILKHFKLMQGDIVTREAQGFQVSHFMEAPDPENYHRVTVTGIYEPFFELDDEVKVGDSIGQVHFVEQPLRAPEVVRAQRSGHIIGLRSPGQVEAGDCVALVAHTIEPNLDT